MYSDVHSHLYEFDDISKEVMEARKLKVFSIFCNSVDLKSIKKSLEISREFSEVKCCLGLHPMDLLKLNEKEINEAFDFISRNQNECIAFGETGLDFKHAKTEKEKELQEKVFLKFIELSKEHGKPLIIHSRRAQKRVLEMISENEAEKVLLHWFIGDRKLRKIAEEKNYFISIGPGILFGEDYQKFAEKIPLKNLMLETDSPVPFEGQPAHSTWIPRIAEKLAEIKGIPEKELIEEISKNVKKLFKLK